MYRRSYLATLGTVAVGTLSGCYGEIARESIVDDDFQSKSSRDVEVEGGETLRVEVRPISPTYQLFLIVVDKRELDRETNVFEAMTHLDQVDGEIAREESPDEETTYVVAVGWFEQVDNLNTDQYHLKITVG